MIRYLYEWIQNLAFYMILITAIWNILPENSYKKYIRFFTGLVMVLMLAAPLTELFQVRGEMQLFYGREEARQQEEIEKKMQEYLRELETIEMPEMPEGAGEMMWDKWKGKPRQLLLLFVSGLLLLFIAAPARGNEREEYFGNGMANTENLAYEEGLENKLEQILMKMEGVGKAEVMLTFKEFSETYTVMEKYPVPQGILIIAEGGGNKVAENNIREAVQALFGLEAHKIRIMKMTQNR